MRRSRSWKSWASVAVCAGVGLLLAALNARPAAAQGFGYAAIAISPSTMWVGAEKGTTTEASVDQGALHAAELRSGDQPMQLAAKVKPRWPPACMPATATIGAGRSSSASTARTWSATGRCFW